MNRKRIMALIMITLIAVDTVLMIVAVAQGNMSSFEIRGGVLVALIIFAYVFVRAVKPKKETEKESE